jgi:hypothetical protein
MTAKEFVMQKMPTAKVEKHKTRGGKNFSYTYYLIRELGSIDSFASGRTESNAWVNAKKNILEQENIAQ